MGQSRMRTIEVDDEVYAELERRVSGFRDTPNQVLRRMLGWEQVGAQPAQQELEEKMFAMDLSRRKKAPKADLLRLIKAGSLRVGQRLFLVDHQGIRVPSGEAVIRGRKLEYDGQLETMSALTSRLMQQEGYRSGAYRGPRHWVTEEGRSIMDLWSDYLKTGAA